jgi:hypothetical protein
MPIKEFDVALDDTGPQRLRYRFTKVSGQVTASLVQFETIIGEERFPVVRYDGVHRFAHRDVLNRRGEIIDKQALPEHLTFGEALTFAAADIKENWTHYLTRFFEGEP